MAFERSVGRFSHRAGKPDEKIIGTIARQKDFAQQEEKSS
ncbi:hypothetical protein RISK_004726 [Rhodopirellula islandica]|uniref:Uncharacterized protein n=1 Tax=Rhodopirellula islandica TaxID=595434 RepID=A0A0J1ED26_RHOIS|nr:hypothetical protein RISK_004726 [Rhodopirellula islandica]